jgi:hypothetical protein
MSTVTEIKSAARRLRAEERVELWRWLSADRSVKNRAQEELRADIARGLHSLETGRHDDLATADELANFMAAIKREGRARRAHTA